MLLTSSYLCLLPWAPRGSHQIFRSPLRKFELPSWGAYFWVGVWPPQSTKSTSSPFLLSSPTYLPKVKNIKITKIDFLLTLGKLSGWDITVVPSRMLLVPKQLRNWMLQDLFTFPCGILFWQILPFDQVLPDHVVPQLLLPGLQYDLRCQNQVPLIIQGRQLNCCYDMLSQCLFQA